MELILVRHGEPLWALDGLNVNDPALTERGTRQAEAAAQRLADPDQAPAPGTIDRLMVSPAVRAKATAAPIADATGLEAEVREWLLEYQLPDAWEGQPVDVAREAFAHQYASSREVWWQGLPGAETMTGFHERIIAGLTAELASAGVRRIDEDGLWEVDEPAPRRWVAVAHGGTNSTVVSHLLGCDPEPWEWERFNMGHASIAVMTTVPLAGAAIWSLRSLGDSTHVQLADRTE